MRPPRNDMAVVNSAAASARRLRAEWLQSITAGLVSADDLIAHAATDEGAPLRKLSLRQVILAPEGAGDVTLARRMAALAALVRVPARPTVGWLIDTRAGGRRLLAWLDGQTERTTPVTGFPFAPLGSARV